jgi:hypothetical protein
MAEPVSNQQASAQPGHDWLEIVATLLLSLAAVATAWSSYQATRWNGEQTRASGRTNALRIEAARAQSLAESENEIDVATFIQWIDARANGDPALEDFYEARFRPEFTPAFEAWIATDPFTTRGAPLTPFAMPEYQVEAAAEAERLDQASRASSAVVSQDIQHAANYVLGVVLFAVSLFFAGISTKIHSPRLRAALLVVGCALFIGTVAWIATFPVRVSI